MVEVPIQGIITGLPSQNDFFFGREKYLKDLHEQLVPSSEDCRKSCLVHGMAGMGKTQVVIEYIYRFKKSYRCIFWLGSQRPPELAVNFAQIAGKVGIPKYESMGQGRRIEAVKDFLERTGTFYTRTPRSELTIQPVKKRIGCLFLITSKVGRL